MLADASQYQIPADSAKVIALKQWPQTLAVNLRSFTKGAKAQLKLKEPMLLPEWADGFVFSANNSGGGADIGFTFHLLVNDADGQTFLYRMESPKVPHRVQYFPNQVKAQPIRFSAPGLERPVLVPAAEGNIEAIGERRMPKPPYRIAGMQIESVAFHPSKGQEESPFEFYLSDFAFTHLSRKGSRLYYALDGEERFGELDPVPAVSLGQLGPHYGEAFSVSWEVRDRYDGQPFLTGGEEFTFKENAAEYPRLLNQKLEIPVTEKGTYWIHINRRWSQKAGAAPQKIDEYEFRLGILNGKDPTRRVPIAESATIPNSAIRMAPDRKSMIFMATEPFVVKTAFGKPENVAATWRMEVRSVNAEEVIMKTEGAFTDGVGMPASIVLDLTDLPASSYRCRAELLVDGKPIDRTERIIGRKNADKAGAGVPASVPSWQKMLASPESFVYLQAHLDEPDPAKRWERMKAFLDQAPTVTTKIEYLFRWRDVEPLPGVYDWSEIDRVLDYAHSKGITALLWPSIVGAEPEWLPSFFEEPRNANGSIFGAPAYLFHGGRLNLWHAPSWRS